MSEYQYYEFLALDHPLDAAQQAEMRALSMRARITAARFTATYEWGDFKGDPGRLMERYYDAHLYLAGWGARRIMLNLPERLLDLPTAQQYCFEDSVTAWTEDGRLILDLASEESSEADGEDGGEEPGQDWDEDPEHSLGAIAGVRAELAAGDHRALYLAWLSAVTAWELQDDDEEEYQGALEPPVPAGLGRLTAPQRALADFLRVGDDLLTAAAQASPDLSEPAGTPDLARWIAALPGSEKDALLLGAAQGAAPHLGAELIRRYRAANPETAGGTATARRSAAQLLDAAAELRAKRD